MKLINDTQKLYQTGGIGKPEFIKEMYVEHHSKLFDFSNHLPKTNIKKIEIYDHHVIMTSRDRGVRMVCPPGDFRVAPHEILNFFDYEKVDAAMIDRLIDDHDCVLDIGANMGWYSINIGLSNRSAKIHCFEPIPQTFAYLQRNIELNSVTGVTAHNFGFATEAGEFDFYFSKEGSGNASSMNVSELEDVQVVKCKVRTLDEFCVTEKLSVDFIKCDVEGAELQVFKGGIKTIVRDRPVIFSEILRKWSAKFNYNPNDIFELMRSVGYKAFTANDGELKGFLAMDESTVETNFFFLHVEKHARKIKALCHES